MLAAFCHHSITSWHADAFLHVGRSLNALCSTGALTVFIYHVLIVQGDGLCIKNELKYKVKTCDGVTMLQLFLYILLGGNKAFIVIKTWQSDDTSVHLQAFWH